jgi:hypothetical protein
LPEARVIAGNQPVVLPPRSRMNSMDSQVRHCLQRNAERSREDADGQGPLFWSWWSDLLGLGALLWSNGLVERRVDAMKRSLSSWPLVPLILGRTLDSEWTVTGPRRLSD